MSRAAQARRRLVAAARPSIMQPLGHLLVVVDPYARGSQPVVDKGARLAASFGATLELFACDADDHPPPIGEARPSDGRLMDLARGLAKPLRALGLEVKVRTVRGGSLSHCLLAHLQVFPAQLVLKPPIPIPRSGVPSSKIPTST